MKKTGNDYTILKEIFLQYILKNPFNRTMMVPVLFTMIVAKYMEVLGARQTENISKMIKSGSTNISILLSYSVVYIISIVLVEIQAFFICKSGQLGSRLANKDAFGYFLGLEPEQFGRMGKGEIQNIISRRSQAVQDMIDVFTLNFFPTLLTIIFTSYEVFKGMGSTVVFVINCSIVLYAIVTVRITEWRNSMRKKLNSAQNNSSNMMMDTLCNFESVYIFKSEDYEVEKYNTSLKTVERHSTELARSLYLLNLSQKSVWWLMSTIIVFFSCYSSSQPITTEKFAFLIYITGLIMKSLDNFGYMYGRYKTAMINARMSAFPDIKKKEDGYRTAFRLNSGITVNEMSIKKGLTPIINNVSFNIKKGDKVAIIGKNGCGKSTLLRSLIKINDFEGDVMVDNIRLKDLTDISLKTIVGFIPQSATLFDGTIMSNIKYNNPKLYEEEIYRISKELGIHESIIKLQNGYLTHVGEQGSLISGGERQKVLILRAMLRQYDVLLMDESTANLDKQSEVKIISTINKIPDLTILSIVHNFELLPFFNKVLLIRGGNVELFEDPSNVDFKHFIE